jgi:anti-sigma-K factor RskA
MNCREVDDRLDDYVDGELPEGEYQEVELHVASCAACRESERGLRNLLAGAAALPKEQIPRRDLWPGVAERLAPRWSGRSLALGLAAGLIVAVAAGLLYRRDSTSTPSTGSFLPVSVESPAALAAAEEDYVRASAALLAALHGRRDTLAPEAIADVEKNLRVIDQALAEVHEALRLDPGNPELTRMLAATHRKKVDVLRRVMKLTT